MKKIVKYISISFLTFGSVIFTSCETTDLEKKDNPNALALTQADPDLLLNSVQLEFAQAMQEFGEASAEVSRLKYMNGRNYQSAYGATNFDNAWEDSYVGVMNNLRVMNKIAEAKGMKKHIGMGQVLEAYTLITLVDMFGKIPYSEAFNVNNLTPKADDEKEVYAKAIILLDNAIANFTAVTLPTLIPKTDLYYNKSWVTWIKVANSIKLKIYLQTRLVDASAVAKFNTIIANNNFIGSNEDFEYKWSSSLANPDSRHPSFVDNYTPSGVDLGYQANWLLDIMKNSKTVQDPRMRYYFYRQVNAVPVNEQDIRCSVEPAPSHYILGNYTYCIINNTEGYWGRDHGNNEGIPNDRQKRTAVGVYPAGGKFDGNNFAAITGPASLTFGGKGAGITPILLASSIDFMRAEMALFGGTGNAKSHMRNGISKSIDKVRAFVSRDATAVLTFVPALTQDALYISAAESNYDAASSDVAKLDVIVTEWFVSLFGNGIDAYNAYRRTGAPKSMQPNLELNPGGFIRSFLYPQSETSTNPNVPQKGSVTQRVFWDNNPSTGFPVGN